MLELKSKTVSVRDELLGRNVQFFVDNILTSLQGNWTWELPADELFCSDVMVAMHLGNPPAVKCLIHPDDLPGVRTALDQEEPPTYQFQFRVITSWGKVFAVKGQGRFQVERNEEFLQHLQQEELNEFTRQQQQKEELERVTLLLTTYQYAELLQGQGV